MLEDAAAADIRSTGTSRRATTTRGVRSRGRSPPRPRDESLRLARGPRARAGAELEDAALQPRLRDRDHGGEVGRAGPRGIARVVDETMDAAARGGVSFVCVASRRPTLGARLGLGGRSPAAHGREGVGDERQARHRVVGSTVPRRGVAALASDALEESASPRVARFGFARPIGRAGGGGAGGDRAPTPRTRREGAGPRAASNRRRRAGGVERAPRLRGARERLDAEPHASQRRGRRDAIAVAGSVAAVRGRGRSRPALARSRGARRRGRPHLGGVQERDDGQAQGDHRGGSRAGARGELAEACRFRRASPR